VGSGVTEMQGGSTKRVEHHRVFTGANDRGFSVDQPIHHKGVMDG
jgi:hypothetical protein